ncbi:putative transcription factor MADS-type1 family [Medicago truncatula]|uniref:MADS-box transcription factor family protein n=1 Tax=Medicago truncatula TaxID=3880 RepID=G7IU48_MEDTR|nr:agamous-like MADS-box protein AGL62 [Medicago truncatula]AES67398.1 MADS-box transcription factor family protein [Medicago truncatula]RHN75878.1 putative transcription factor MADS-type1 family [Medicago truncatula]
MSSAKKGRGRQKIEMKKMSNESHLQVTFSKRRSGLFKKASELCTLCGADAALVVFSTSGKVFSFGHPNLDTVIDRYLSLVPPQNNDTVQFIEAHRNANVRELNAQLTQINSTLEAEKKIGDELSNLHKETQAKFWWACPADGMNRDQLELFKKALEELKKLVIQHATIQTLPFFVGNASSSNIYLHHQPIPQQAQMFPPQIFQNPMLQLQPHLFDGLMMPHHGFNNMV